VLNGRRRVLDLGCGTGRHAIGLARLGFEVTGVDVSAYALRRAAQAAADARVQLRLCHADLLSGADWGVPPADAAICVQAFGWGTDADQLRILRSVRQLLAPDGLLVLDHSSIHAIARMYQPRAEARVRATTFTFNRRYDPLSGRSGGQVLVSRGDGTQAVLEDDVRLYTPAEVGALLIRAGFEVIRADADFQAGAAVTISTRYAQFLALPARSAGTALDSHRSRPPAGHIDLRKAPDEAEFSRAAVAAAWPETGLPELARRYDLDDPYGGARAAPVLAAHLGWPSGHVPDDARVSVGAGVTGLLHGLSRLADGGIVLTAPDGHPQLAEDAASCGARAAVAPLPGPAAFTVAVHDIRPAVAVIDRPALTGDCWPAASVRELAASAAGVGGVLVVDETCGCYLPPADSCAPLTDTVPGLVVLRGVSKGYCCGGLRIGFAVASPDLAARVRAVLAPLAGSALALEVALRLLRQPDPLAPLRARIAEVKPPAEEAARRAGMAVVATDARVPWIALDGDPATRAALARAGLTVREVHPRLLRMSVPLSDARARAVAAALSAVSA
jgi:histidinol-phosphate/aromatic aminotransferase/cobyric acid decarboxylase-like protein/ubiquinone/menaquinone biosynthesis C-methylase UbiE